MTKSIPYSVLDLAPVVVGGTARDAFVNSLDLARHAERLGYHRFWLAEHHGIPGVASAATAVAIAYVAGGTKTIRVGSGGVMLPNHPPLVVAEQFGTLESLYPGRIDLGIGRAPGGDPRTMRALRRAGAADTFPQDLVELMAYFRGDAENGVRAIPGAGLDVPVYLLGSSDFSARVAARLGVPFAFASHFAPDYLDAALEVYRAQYRPSERWPMPHVMVTVNVFAAESDAEGRRLFTSLQQAFLNLVRGRPGEIPPPVETMDGVWMEHERAHVEHMTRYSAVGSKQTVREGLESVVRQTGADEIIVTGQIFDHAARVRSFEIAAEVLRETAKPDALAVGT